MSRLYGRHRPVVITSIALAVGMLGPLTTALAVVGSDPGASTANDDNAAVYQDGYKGAAGYLPVFHPTPLTAAAVIFFVLLWPFARWVARLERDMLMRQR